MSVGIDLRDASVPEPRGWTRYATELFAALERVPEAHVQALTGPGWRGPEVLWEQAGLPLALRRAGVEVVHAPNVFLPLVRGCAGVVTIHDLAFEAYPDDFVPRTRKKFQWIAPRAARSAERVVCVSRFTADDVCARYGIDPAKVRVVHNGPSLTVSDRPPPDRPPYLLGVGDLRAKKNWGRLVAAWRALRASGHPELGLVIAGTGDGAPLRAAAAGDPLELPGYVDDAELDALMRGAAVLVHPSLYEGFGLVVAEALVRGTPVAAARGTALPEAGGDAAVYFDPLDVDGIAAAVQEALRRTDELRALGHARAAELTWDRAAAETVRVYREAACARRS